MWWIVALLLILWGGTLSRDYKRRAAEVQRLRRLQELRRIESRLMADLADLAEQTRQLLRARVLARQGKIDPVSYEEFLDAHKLEASPN
jgi:hypothetical protein